MNFEEQFADLVERHQELTRTVQALREERSEKPECEDHADLSAKNPDEE